MAEDRAQARRLGRDARDGAPAATAGEADEQVLLQRIVSRLCVAFGGSDPHLDQSLRDLRKAMRAPNNVAALEKMLDGLTAAIKQSDDSRAGKTAEAPAAPAPAAPIAVAPVAADLARKGRYGTEPVPAAQPNPGQGPVLRLLEKVELIAGLQQRLAELRTRLAASTTETEVAETLQPIAAVINQQRDELQAERDKISAILQQVSGQLDEMALHLTDEFKLQAALSDDKEKLNQALLGEVRALDSSARAATDLGQLQEHVRSRLDLINEHLHKFTECEAARMCAYRTGTERMKSRVEQLERETHQLQESVQREQQRATTDLLTGVPNRLAFQQRIDAEFERWRGAGGSLCIALWDIDRFKSVNDTYGHPAGDKALRIVAQHILRSLRKSDFLARYGGEEFVAILHGVGGTEAIQHADRIRQSLEQLGIHFDQKRLAITASCGIAAFAADDTIETVIQHADAALYKAKRSGRNRCLAG
jgi:diguanylate cyclase